MEGLVIGTIDRTTSIMNAGADFESIDSESGLSQAGNGDSSIQYYSGVDRLLTGLLKCVLTQEKDWWQVQWTQDINSGKRSNLFMTHSFINAPYYEGCAENLDAARKTYQRWFDVNAGFLIDNTPLPRWFDETTLIRWTLMMIKTGWGMVLAFTFMLIVDATALFLVFHLGNRTLDGTNLLVARFFTIVGVLGSPGVTFFAYPREYPRSTRPGPSKVDEIVYNGMLFTSQRLLRLVVCDTGMLGMGTPYARVGDGVCLLAGCAIPVIVRRRREVTLCVDSGRQVCEVVGSATV